MQARNIPGLRGRREEGGFRCSLVRRELQYALKETVEAALSPRGETLPQVF